MPLRKSFADPINVCFSARRPFIGTAEGGKVAKDLPKSSPESRFFHGALKDAVAHEADVPAQSVKLIGEVGRHLHLVDGAFDLIEAGEKFFAMGLSLRRLQ